MYAIKCWTRAQDPILRDLSDRFINRRLFSGVRLDERLNRLLERQSDIVEAVRAAGFDEPEYYYHIDKTSNLAYSYYVKPTEGGSPPIQVLVDWTKPPSLREVTTMSDVLKSIATERVTRYVLFVPKEAVAAVQAILEAEQGLPEG